MTGQRENDAILPSSEAEPASLVRNAGWLACVLFAVVPLLAFVTSLEALTNGNVPVEALWRSETWNGLSAFSPAALAHVSIGFFSYGVYVFVHALICIAVTAFFVSRLASTRRFTFSMSVCAVYAFVVVAGVWLMSALPSAFRGYLLTPIQATLIATKSTLSADSWLGTEDSYMLFALVFPTGLGIIAVILATGSFHAALLFGKDESTPQDAFDDVIEMLRHDVMALSLVLVSSVLTARAFFSIPVNVFNPENKQVAGVYSSLVETLSTGAGLLFSATLIAAFLPGFLLAISAPAGEGPDVGRLVTRWSRLASSPKWLGKKLKET